MDTLVVGPEQGTLTLTTGVEGTASRMGHSLTVVVHDWRATTTFEGDLPVQLQLRAVLDSLEVLSGAGGVTPLGSKEKAIIRTTALELLTAGQHPEVLFASSAVHQVPGGFSVPGLLTVAGTSRPTTLAVQVADAGELLSLVCEVPVVQSAHGVKPYSTMMGALRVRDRVDVRVAVSVPRP